MSFSSQTWDQIRNISADTLIKALEKDDWLLDTMTGGSMMIYKKNHNRVSVHYHAGKTFGSKLLKGLLKDTDWNEDDLRRLKLIK